MIQSCEHMSNEQTKTNESNVTKMNQTFVTFDATKRAKYIKIARSRIAYKKCNHDDRVIKIRDEYAKNATKNEIIEMINTMIANETKTIVSNDAIENELLTM